MSRFRQSLRDTVAPSRSIFTDILLIEDSQALGMLMRERIQQEIPARIHWAQSMSEAREKLAERNFALAVTGLNLPDAPDGEILDVLSGYGVPSILFTACFDRDIRERYAASGLIDYFVKDGVDAVDQVIQTISRLARNNAITVLVVDDSRSTRMILTDLLRRQNFHVLEAGCGNEALAMLAANPSVELVITDYNMPDMNGHELTRRIRADHPADQLRIIGISSSTDRFLSASFLKAGASDFIYRPFVAEELQCRIDNNVETLRQIKRLRYLAERDPLSGLYNRRAFFERAEKLVDHCRTKEGEASVAILDIDHFKKVNDGYGHDAGDLVIRAVAGILDEFAQRHDFLTARFGGEEFAVLFGGRDGEAVKALCEDIRTTIAGHGVTYEDSAIAVTASIGVARLQLDEGLDNNLNAADQMLYMAKAAGRNRVMSDMAYC